MFVKSIKRSVRNRNRVVYQQTNISLIYYRLSRSFRFRLAGKFLGKKLGYEQNLVVSHVSRNMTNFVIRTL